ncbi:RNase H family protein [Streptomyces sp. HB2AG]|uniref:RNase H family protein n=1 Tax=Streptomyces sp. HB2AG TaxID=2983400 RepID=UPI0022AA556D|nr:RNase H family protein [Streptomyces sp. HB2AG]MCZ2525372.1 hypothetical protein [Streptomyces sp. HB2AG]
MAQPTPAALVTRLASDFAALQEAALANAFGTASPETAAALASPELADAHTGALVHAEVLARGDLHRTRFDRVPAREHRVLRTRLRTVARARRQAAAAAKQHRDASGTPPWARPPLAARVLRTARPEEFTAVLGAVCAERGLTTADLYLPGSRVWEWARDRGLVAAELPTGAAELLARTDEEFVRALLDDAREEENPHLAHDAVVERWDAHARTAQAWGRYAVASAERSALTHPATARATRLDALDAAYQDAAVLALRAHEAACRRTGLRARIEHLAAPATGELRQACEQEAARRLAAAEPALWEAVGAASTAHESTCARRDDDCPSCHRALADPFLLPSDTPAVLTGTGDPYPDENPDAARYALLDDVPADTPWAVADAAVDAEESALCGYGWAAADGTAGWGDSMASSSGEAEVVGICRAALALVGRHPQQQVLVLCDSVQAVNAVRSALEAGDASAAHRTALFPEARALLDQVLPHRDRVEVRWLKGHIGHDLNEAADALAGLALRRANGRTPAPEARRTAARLLRDLESGAGSSPSPAAA